MKEEIMFAARNVNGIRRRNILRKGFVLENVDFELPVGYIMGVVGKNGAGKTTLFDYIMSERKRYTGEFMLEGRDIGKEHLWALDNIGFISEENEFLEQRTAGQNAQMLGRFFTGFDRELFGRIMEECKLSDKKTVGRMSRGEKVRFQLAFAAAHKPKLFLLDEATAGMDPVFRIDFYKLLRGFLEEGNCAVLMSTHLEEEIEKELDYVGVLEKGRFVSFHENGPV